MADLTAEAQLAVVATLLDQVRQQMTVLVKEQEDTNTRLAKLESWRSFVLGVWAAATVVGGVAGWFANTLIGH